MKRAPLLLVEIKLIPSSIVRSDMQDDELLQLSNSIAPIYYTPGTGFLSFEKKASEAGEFYEMEFGYSVPSALTVDELAQLNGIGAAILKTDNERVFIFHRNDFESNVPLLFDIKGELSKTLIKSSVISIQSP